MTDEGKFRVFTVDRLVVLTADLGQHLRDHATATQRRAACWRIIRWTLGALLALGAIVVTALASGGMI